MNARLAGRIAAIIGLFAVIGVIAVAVGDFGANDEALAPQSIQIENPPIIRVADELVDIEGWLQSDVSSLAELRGDIVVVQFWTFGCYNCKNTLANLSALYELHQGDNFEVVGVHAPEFDFEADLDNIAEAAEELGVTWPIAVDNNKTNFGKWQGDRRFWPRTYVLDGEGNIRFDHVGEGKYDELNATVAYLLEEARAQT